MTPVVLVIGPESSGGRLVFRLMNSHPDIQAVHFSFPYGPASGHRYMPTANNVLSHNPTHAFITTRDWDAMLRSKVRNHEPDERIALQEQREALIALFDIAACLYIPWRTVSYEALVADPEKVSEELFTFIGVTPIPVAEDVYDGNV